MEKSRYNPDRFLGPFNVLTMNSMKANWLFKALIPAYGNNLRQLRADLRALDRELTASFSSKGINPTRRNIWAWTWDVRVQDVQVIIVGNQPTLRVFGSGHAFHPLNDRQVSESVREIIRQVAVEFGMKPPHPKRDFSLRGWINQGVVLVNGIPTRGRRYETTEHGAWIPILQKLFSYIYSNDDEVKVILAGRSRNFYLHEEYSDCDDYRIQLAHHPCNPNQNRDKRFNTLAKCLRLTNARVDWTALDMWR